MSSDSRCPAGVLIALVAAGAITLVSCGGGQQSATQEPAAAAPPEAKPHWTYTAESGPANWGTLSPDYVACAEGTSQSPIDIASAGAASASSPIAVQYGAASLSIDHHEMVTDVVDNGHTIQVNCAGGGSVSIGGQAFELAQFHFHSPSEHTVDGKSFPMEMHMVHKSAHGALAVIGTLVQEGRANPAFDAIWANLPSQKGQEVRLPEVTVEIDKLLPANRAAYRYDGSLTTPPCSEGVKWLVMKTPISLSADQIAKFRAIIHDNNRPTQALNGRAVAMESVTPAAVQ